MIIIITFSQSIDPVNPFGVPLQLVEAVPTMLSGMVMISLYVSALFPFMFLSRYSSLDFIGK